MKNKRFLNIFFLSAARTPIKIIQINSKNKLSFLLKGNKKIEQIVLKNAIDILHTHGFIPDIVCSRVKKSKKIVGAVATVAVFEVFTRLIGFLFKIYLSRALGAEALGLYQIALSVFFLFSSLPQPHPLFISNIFNKNIIGGKDEYKNKFCRD